MNKFMRIRLLIVAILIVLYVIVAALDLSREIVAPFIIVGVAAAVFVPRGSKKKQSADKE
ncbi:putative secreted or membrane protein [Corynebacterium glutamicum MB001]|uniref:Protein-disulfide reductase n=2 Tax=Corynebacterium glutamicum TaxID=1718 RepID=A0AB72VC15_CORGB|nr:MULTISPECIES: hypothetical protein [Corynebacterium]AGT05920.1 putative secreted or membrane protein [Corynebacterium glutamicum MB001]AJE67853.1 hypothetical protein SB89_09985 [Corynebacterium glutamicum]ALP50623.1 hypothetical protein AC079_10580 [Corynebacterium glutamicum]ANR63035.1 hypothetical protein C628_10535 [[Brevibacterium] flavum ZL-1]ANR66040.1 hypothetical protein C627_10435 [Corynebacterium glutamicum ZL-6]